MDFARKQMEKYGWEEGKGLGKHESGITTALKPKLKFDTAGVGHNLGKEFTNNWWENVYNNASKNVKVKKTKDDVKMELVTGESIEVSTKNYSVKDFRRKNGKMVYGSFLKTSKLTASGEEKYDGVFAPEEAGTPKIVPLTDEELFAACEGRTAHKGARHGLKLSGKLSRIEKQEKMLLKKLQKVSITDDENTKVSKKLKKLKGHEKQEQTEASQPPICPTTKKKRRKKIPKNVSFSETVTEYYSPDPDTSPRSSESADPPVVLQAKIKDDDLNAQDEGIEQDCDIRSEDLGQQSFAEVQHTKKDKKHIRASQKFLQEVFPTYSPLVTERSAKKNRKFLRNDGKYKRKHDEDADISMKFKKRCEEISSKSMRKKKKKKQNDEKVAISAINSIVASLDKVCKISGTE